MTNSCPDCGKPMDFEQRDVSLRTGTCPSCTKEFAFVQGTTVSARFASPPSGSAVEADASAVVAPRVAGGPECEDCGSPLAFREGKAGSLLAVCDDCGTTNVYVPQREAPRLERTPERPQRAERPERFGDGPPRGRPCRKCGAPLNFTTGDDGMLVGECGSCGNRFVLPPRTDGGREGGGDRGRPRFGQREFRTGRGARPSYGGGRSDRGGRPFRGGPRRGPPRDDDDDRRKNRRRRDE